MAGSDRVADPNDSKRARVGKAQTSARAKWRFFWSACRSVVENCLTLPTLLEMGIFHHSRQRRPQYVLVGSARTAKGQFAINHDSRYASHAVLFRFLYCF